LKPPACLGNDPSSDLHRALADPWGSLHETFPPNRGIFPPRCSTRSSALSSIGALPLRRLAGAHRKLGLGLEQPPAHLGLCRSGLPLHTHRANGRSRGAAAGPGQLRAAAASSQNQRTEQLLRCCEGSQGAATIRPRRVPHSSSALDWVPSRGTEHGRLRLAAL